MTYPAFVGDKEMEGCIPLGFFCIWGDVAKVTAMYLCLYLNNCLEKFSHYLDFNTVFILGNIK